MSFRADRAELETVQKSATLGRGLTMGNPGQIHPGTHAGTDQEPISAGPSERGATSPMRSRRAMVVVLRAAGPPAAELTAKIIAQDHVAANLLQCGERRYTADLIFHALKKLRFPRAGAGPPHDDARRPFNQPDALHCLP